jgi:hypothetical protein
MGENLHKEYETDIFCFCINDRKGNFVPKVFEGKNIMMHFLSNNFNDREGLYVYSHKIEDAINYLNETNKIIYSKPNKK